MSVKCLFLKGVGVWVETALLIVLTCAMNVDSMLSV